MANTLNRIRPEDVIRQALLSNQDRVDLGRNRPSALNAVPTVTSDNDLGGAEDSEGLNIQFESALNRMIAESGGKISITSGRRSNQRQQELWQQALAKYGDPEIADNWVARPGTSNHEKGTAADLKYADDAAREWAHSNAGLYGLQFPLSNEAWHIEPVGNRGDEHNHQPTSTGQSIPRPTSFEPTRITQPADRDWFMTLLEGSQENDPQSIITQALSSNQSLVKRRTEGNAQAAIQQALSGPSGASPGGSTQGNSQYSGVSDPDLAWLIDHESDGRVEADNPNSTAFGLGQLTIANRRAIGQQLGFDPETRDYNQQLAMMNEYIRGRYGSPQRARQFWEQNGWY